MNKHGSSSLIQHLHCDGESASDWHCPWLCVQWNWNGETSVVGDPCPRMIRGGKRHCKRCSGNTTLLCEDMPHTWVLYFGNRRNEWGREHPLPKKMERGVSKLWPSDCEADSTSLHNLTIDWNSENELWLCKKQESVRQDSQTFIIGKTGQTHHFWGGNFCGVVTEIFLVHVLQKFALDFFFTTPLRL